MDNDLLLDIIKLSVINTITLAKGNIHIKFLNRDIDNVVILRN